jgi:CRP/FNR family cyclic AMP-dependent transcriptional regulator
MKDRKMPKINLFNNAERFETYKAGQVIFKQGQPSEKMYIVIEGKVNILVGNFQVGLVEEGGILGEMGVLEGTTRSATAIAHTDCKIVSVDLRRFNFLVQNTPYFATEVIQIMAERLRRMNQRITA